MVSGKGVEIDRHVRCMATIIVELCSWVRKCMMQRNESNVLHQADKVSEGVKSTQTHTRTHTQRETDEIGHSRTDLYGDQTMKYSEHPGRHRRQARPCTCTGRTHIFNETEDPQEFAGKDRMVGTAVRPCYCTRKNKMRRNIRTPLWLKNLHTNVHDNLHKYDVTPQNYN